MEWIRKYQRVPAPLLSLLVLSLLTGHAAGEGGRVNEHLIEVALIPDKPVIMLGEPTYLSFLVRNHGDQDLQVLVGGDCQNALGRPESFTVTVTRDDGKRVPQPYAGISMGGGLFGPQKLPAQGSYAFRLFLPHWAAFEESGTYSIVAGRILKLSSYTPHRWDPNEKATDVPAQASATIVVVPQDRKKMGEVIAALGERLLGPPTDEAASAGRMLSYIQDERVIPHFIKALETRGYEQKFTALGALAKFNDEAALAALKRGFETKGQDIGWTTTPEVAAKLAESIRITAAAALARSPHPGAAPFLLSKRHDACAGVRITVLHRVGKMRAEEAIPILREMTQDESQLIREEAKRYLKLFSSEE